MYAPNSSVFNFIKQTQLDMKDEVGAETIMGDFNTLFSSTNKSI